MKGMILAAGRGERMGELTRATAKPLLKIGKYFLIEYALFSLRRGGIKDIVINISYLANQIQAALGDGSRYGLKLTYSYEKERLETGGGIQQALSLLGDEAFVVISADIITDFNMASLPEVTGLGHVVLVDNPSFHPKGDFALVGNKLLLPDDAMPSFTFANISILHPQLFRNVKPGYFRLADLLFPAVKNGEMTGEYYQGLWYNIGTPKDLDDINHAFPKENGLPKSLHLT